MSLLVTPVLGVVEIIEGGLLKENSRPAANSTRWLVDVVGEVEDKLVLQLINVRGQKAQPDLVSCSFQPYSASFYDAKPFYVPSEEVSGVIVIRHGGFVHGPQVALPGQEPTFLKAITCRYRVLIDALHTATR